MPGGAPCFDEHRHRGQSVAEDPLRHRLACCPASAAGLAEVMRNPGRQVRALPGAASPASAAGVGRPACAPSGNHWDRSSAPGRLSAICCRQRQGGERPSARSPCLAGARSWVLQRHRGLRIDPETIAIAVAVARLDMPARARLGRCSRWRSARAGCTGRRRPTSRRRRLASSRPLGLRRLDHHKALVGQVAGQLAAAADEFPAGTVHAKGCRSSWQCAAAPMDDVQRLGLAALSCTNTPS